MLVEEGQNRRLDFRQDDVLYMKAETLSEEQLKIEKNRAGTQRTKLLQSLASHDLLSEGGRYGHLDPNVSSALEILDEKLNYLIGINVAKQSDCSDLEEHLVNMSVSGMRFTMQGDCKVNDWLKITLRLPLFPPVIIELLAKVMHVKAMSENKIQLGVAFSYRCEDEEDAITTYIFKRHRETIRIKYREHRRYSRLKDSDLT